MSVKAVHYITGDTQQSGFRRIGGSPSFPADQLPYLNNGEPIPEQARVQSGQVRQGRGNIQELSRVWEYQTGDYGKPVIIQSIVAIGSGRQHGFSEYVAAEIQNVAETAEPWKLIRSAEKHTKLLDTGTFMEIPGKEELEFPEDDVWNPEEITDEPRFSIGVDEQWKRVVLSHYWKQASIRAFSHDTPATVRVNLGDFDDDPAVDNAKTIEQAKLFFADIMVRSLPKQVQNIASVSAGVNGADTCTLYSALEFDMALNLIGDESLLLDRQSVLRGYKLTRAENDFIGAVISGKTPEVVRAFFDRFIQVAKVPEATETNTPFMADYRVWYGLYCMDHIIKEKQSFIDAAGLANEHGNPRKVRMARICFTLMRQMHQILESEHRLNEIRKNLVTELLEPVENGLLQVMLEDMESDGAEPFMLRRNDMLEFHRRMLYSAPESQLDVLIRLAVRDQQVSKAPQFVRCYPAISLRNEMADERNAKALSALLEGAVRPLIDAEINNEKIENKYLNELRSDDFAKGWACLDKNVHTKKAVEDFLWEEIQNPQKHFLLYGISKVYLPLNNLLLVTLRHFSEHFTSRNTRPSERQLKIAEDGCKEYVANPSSADPECLHELNRYYQACYREYEGTITSLSEMVRQLGGDTSEAMKLILDEKREGSRMTPDQAKAVFETFGGKGGVFSRNEAVIDAYSGMIAAQRDTALTGPQEENGISRENLIRWMAEMAEAAPFEVNNTDNIRCIIDHAKSTERMNKSEAELLFGSLGGELKEYANNEQVVRSYAEMLFYHLNKTLLIIGDERDLERENLVRWIADMADAAPFRVDTSDAIRTLFESGKTGTRITKASAEEIFRRLMPNAVSGNEKVRPAFAAMLKTQLDNALEAKDDSVLEWIGGMISTADGYIDLDTTDMLKKIYDHAGSGDRMRPADSEVALNTLGPKAEGINSTVQRAFSDMLASKRKEALEQGDEEAFEWLCAMGDRSIWKDNQEWLDEQHAENTIFLCGISEEKEQAAHDTFLSTIQTWLEQKTIQTKGINRLQKYCNHRLERDDKKTAERFLPYFDQIDSSCEKLRDLMFDQTVAQLKEDLVKGAGSFGEMISDCRAKVEKSGRRLDDLYEEVKPEVSQYLKEHFETTTNLRSLIDEQEKIPINTGFYKAWQDMLSEQIFSQQVELFKRQPNIDRMIALKQNVLQRSNRSNKSLDAAYKLIESYEDRIRTIEETTEFEAVISMGRQLSEVNDLLNQADDVRKSLCTALREAYPSNQKDNGDMDERHRLCTAILNAHLTDEPRIVKNEVGASAVCPDWNRVLGSIFTKAELDEASRKPYAKKNLPTLQKLLSTLETVRVMTAYDMNLGNIYGEDLLKAIHSNSELHRYQSALSRNKKMCDFYNLSFNADGLQFNMKNE